jgi:hypothetical protein
MVDAGNTTALRTFASKMIGLKGALAKVVAISNLGG